MNMKHRIAAAAMVASTIMLAASQAQTMPPANPAAVSHDEEDVAVCGESPHDKKAAASGAIVGCALGVLCSGLSVGLDLGACLLALCGAGAFAGSVAADEIADAIDGATDCAGVGYSYRKRDGGIGVHYCYNYESHDGAVKCIKKLIRDKKGTRPQMQVRFDTERYSCGANVWGLVDDGHAPFFGRGATASEAHNQALSYCEDAATDCRGGRSFCNEWNK